MSNTRGHLETQKPQVLLARAALKHQAGPLHLVRNMHSLGACHSTPLDPKYTIMQGYKGIYMEMLVVAVFVGQKGFLASITERTKRQNTTHLLWSNYKLWIKYSYTLYIYIYFFYWSTVDLHCSRCIARWFSYTHMCMHARSLQFWLFVTPWTVALQVPLSMGFSR